MHSEMQLVFVGVLTEQARPFLRTKLNFHGRAGAKFSEFGHLAAGASPRPTLL